jgi:SRSO17 transposase
VALRALASRTGYREGLPGPEVWVLIRQPLPAPGQSKAPELKYYLSNAPADTPLAELIRICGMRWPIECCFEEGKGDLGMDQYELRFWRGWHHHMTLVLLAHHFLVRLRQRLMARASAAPPPLGERAEGREGGVHAPGH